MFPEDLGTLVADMARQFGFNMVAEAAIVNFYPSPKCYMGGHLGMCCLLYIPQLLYPAK
jgi:hypothetical protein